MGGNARLAGSCQGLYTANTMACMTEALGTSLPRRRSDTGGRCGKTPACTRKQGLCRWSRPRPCRAGILTLQSFSNAIKVDMALGGLMNTVLHLMAIAQEAELRSRYVPRHRPHHPAYLTCSPAACTQWKPCTMPGVPSVMNRLAASLDDVMTVSGKTVLAIAREHP